jgi:hypothetical protein
MSVHLESVLVAAFVTGGGARIRFLTCGFDAPAVIVIPDVPRSFTGLMRDETAAQVGVICVRDPKMAGPPPPVGPAPRRGHAVRRVLLHGALGSRQGPEEEAVICTSLRSRPSRVPLGPGLGSGCSGGCLLFVVPTNAI